VNGKRVAQSTISLTPFALGATNRNWIGKSQFGADPNFDGSIDDFRIYDYALSAGEMEALASGFSAAAVVTKRAEKILSVTARGGTLRLFVPFTGAYRITVINPAGRTIWTQCASGPQALTAPPHLFSRGIYFVHVAAAGVSVIRNVAIVK
jgi:hypothetical protein